MGEVDYFERGYPPPAPQTKTPEEIFNAKDFCNIDNKARQAPAGLENDLDKLMTFLMEGTTSDLSKVRAIFVWLSGQDVISRAFPKVVRPNTPIAWLKKIKLDRSFYAELFTIMCRKANVKCVIIEGFSKGAGFEVGKSKLNVVNRWNAVHVEGSWHLINVAWALVAVDGVAEGEWMKVEATGVAVREHEVARKEVKKDLDEFWFLTKPEEFVVFFFPKDPKWQLLEHPWTSDDFLNTPRFDKAFLSSDWEIVTDPAGRLVAKNGTCTIGFEHRTEGVQYATLQYNLYFNTKESPNPLPEEEQLERYVLVDSQKGKKSLVFRLPQEGVYRAEVAGILNDTLTVLGEFRIECPPFQKVISPFPAECKEIGFTETSADLGLDSPSHEGGIVQAKPDEKVDLSLKFSQDKPKPKDVRATVTHGSMPAEELTGLAKIIKNDEGVTVTVQMDKNKNINELGVVIDVLLDSGGGEGGDESEEIQYVNAINYILTQDDDLSFAEEKAIMKENSDLLNSINSCDTARFFRMYESIKDTLNPMMRSKVETFLKDLNKIKGQKMKDLVQAMYASDVTALETALEAYECLGEVNQDSVRQARATLELLRVMKAEDSHVTSLEIALQAALRAGLKGNSNVQKAEDTLVALYNKDLGEAYYRRSLDSLNSAVKAVSASCVKGRIEQEPPYSTAMELQKHLKEMKAVTDEVGRLKSQDLKKLGGAFNSEPHPHVKSVLMATFILLGEKEADLWNWSVIQNLLDRRSEAGVARAMASLDLDAVDSKRVTLAARHVGACQEDVLAAENPHSALFFKWVQGIVEEKKARDAVKHLHTQITAGKN